MRRLGLARGGVEASLVDAAAIVVAWGMLLLAENVAVAVLWQKQFSASWEIVLARRLVAPIALAVLAPWALLASGGWRLVASAGAGRIGAKRGLGLLGAAGAGAVALGVSSGRHFTGWPLRLAFVVAVAAAGFFFGSLLLPRLSSLVRRPVALAALGLAVCASSWIADEYVLPRLYPAFHVAMLVSTLLGAALVAVAVRAGARPATLIARTLAVAVGLVVVACAAWTSHAVRALERASNLRLVLVEHAPMLGRAVVLAMRIRPPDPDLTLAPAAAAPGEVARSLDWNGHDIVLVSVDALRADHVSAYGYARATTPNLDALARQGAMFQSAYCPTPHTSYSVTSMMTGKYLRPLLALGVGADSETWAEALRRYGWRTAAFYPPAVFFIDEDRFSTFEQSHLGFEYAKVEFADPALRERQIAGYLDGATGASPLFLWVHFFEPHEPYVSHPDHVFTGGASPDVDAYDGEVAVADDGIGRVVRLVRERRPGAVIVVTADHGEEFGEHGGRYHGTTVYEEQVRVPLVIAGPGVRAGMRVAAVVQTIDLLPTVLSAVGIPRPARLRGRDLGPLLSGDPRANDGGFAFAETDDYSLVASGPDRLVCERRAAACALYRPADDPLEQRDRAGSDEKSFQELRTLLRGLERDHGRFEEGRGPAWPEALRRGMQGDVDAAPDVASLLDDADVVIRRKAAEVCFALHAPATLPHLKRAEGRDEDETVRRWASLALARAGGPPPPLAFALLEDASTEWRRRAALALAERGDARTCDVLAQWWSDLVPVAGQGSPDGEPPRLATDLTSARELLSATANARCRSSVPALERALDDVRARPYVADALGALGDPRARAPLLALFASEPYVTSRPHEARALLALGVRDWAATGSAADVHAALPAPKGPSRMIVLLSDPAAKLDVYVDGDPVPCGPAGTEVHDADFTRRGPSVRIDLHASSGGVVAVWLVSTAT